MKLKPLQSNAVSRLHWAEGVITTESDAAHKLYEMKEEDPVGYEFLLNEIREFGEFSPETRLLLALMLEDDLYERLECVCQAIAIMNNTEIIGLGRN
jgi:hypothetical protein